MLYAVIIYGGRVFTEGEININNIREFSDDVGGEIAYKIVESDISAFLNMENSPVDFVEDVQDTIKYGIDELVADTLKNPMFPDMDVEQEMTFKSRFDNIKYEITIKVDFSEYNEEDREEWI